MQTMQSAKPASRSRRVAPQGLSEKQVLAMPESAYMNDAQMSFFKAKLNAILVDLDGHAKENLQDVSQKETTADPSDRATAEEAHSQALRTAVRDADKRSKVEAALANIASGDYGWCAETGEPIGIERLLAQPTATLSFEAQSRREKLVKFRN